MVFEKNFDVIAHEVNSEYRLLPSVLCSYFQEAAASHTIELSLTAFHLIPKGLTWLLTDFHLEINELPVWGDRVTVKTWHYEPKALRIRRDFSLHFPGQEKALARAGSVWVMVNTDTGRPVKLTGPLPGNLDRFEKEPGQGLSPLSVISEPKTRVTSSIDITVMNSDIDFNNHVNNIRYIQWMCDSLPGSFRKNKIPRELRICFLKEIFEEDRVFVETKQSEETFHHGLYTQNKEIKAATGYTKWSFSTDDRNTNENYLSRYKHK